MGIARAKSRVLVTVVESFVVFVLAMAYLSVTVLCAAARIGIVDVGAASDRWRPWRAYAATHLWQLDAECRFKQEGCVSRGEASPGKEGGVAARKTQPCYWKGH